MGMSDSRVDYLFVKENVYSELLMIRNLINIL